MTDHTPSEVGFDPTDPIVAAWADQGEAGAPRQLTSDLAALVDSVAEAHRKDQRRLFWVNVREFVPSLVVAGALGFSVSGSARPLATLVAAALVLAVGCFLVVSSIRHQRADRRWGISVRDQLARRLAQVNHRAWLYRNVAWWYLLPIAVAIVLFQYGIGGDVRTGEGLAFFGFCIGLFAVLYRMNRKIGRTRYEPEVERLESLLAELDRAV